MTDQPKRIPTDWEAIEREYRAGQLSVMEIARQHGITDAAIRKRAKQKAWARDLGNRVRQKAHEKLTLDAGSGFGSDGGSGSGSGSGLLREDEDRAVEAAAERSVAVVRQHRTMLRNLLGLGQRLFVELDTTTTRSDDLMALIEEATKDDKSPKRRDAMMRSVELPGRIGAFKDLSMAVKNLLPLERQAFSLDAVVPTEGGSLADLVAQAVARQA